MKIATISTSRADASALDVVAEALVREHDVVELRSHFGAAGICKRLPVMLDEHKPDLAFIHGDRWDALIAATLCVKAGIKVAHLGGGAVTAGSYDNRFRYAISELADLHFVATKEEEHQLLATDCDRDVHVVGEPAIDWLKTADLPSRGCFALRCDELVLVNWQPETAAEDPNAGLRLILAALQHLPGTTAIYLCRPGDDLGAEEATEMLEDFKGTFTGRRVVFPAEGYGRVDYAALMKHCDVMVGNSSSGLIEAQVFGTPFIMVGDRQRGRLMGGNVTWVRLPMVPELLAGSIKARIAGRRAPIQEEITNPYGDGTAGERIAKALRHEKVRQAL